MRDCVRACVCVWCGVCVRACTRACVRALYAGSSLATSHLAVNACLTPLCSMHGLAVTTIEAIGDTKTRLHPVQVGQRHHTKRHLVLIVS